MAGWLDRLFGSQDNEPITMPKVNHPLAFDSKNAAETAAPAPKPKGISLSRPAAFKDPGIPTLPKSYMDMVAAGIDPTEDAEEIGPGFVQGYDMDEEGDLQSLHRDSDPWEFGVDEIGGPINMNAEAPESPFAAMTQQSMIRDVDPEAGYVAGESGVADAIHKAMQAHKMKTGAFSGNRQDSIFNGTEPKMGAVPDVAPLMDNDVVPDTLPNSNTPLTALNIQSQTPQFSKQNLFKALMSRMH
jgi:hypothetical protein